MTRKSKRLAIMLKHKELIKQGDMKTAWLLLHLLRRKRITLGYSDEEHKAECILEKIGCVITYSGRYYLATVHDFGK